MPTIAPSSVVDTARRTSSDLICAVNDISYISRRLY
jgi:hypothetical protein